MSTSFNRYEINHCCPYNPSFSDPARYVFQMINIRCVNPFCTRSLFRYFLETNWQDRHQPLKWQSYNLDSHIINSILQRSLNQKDLIFSVSYRFSIDVAVCLTLTSLVCSDGLSTFETLAVTRLGSWSFS